MDQDPVPVDPASADAAFQEWLRDLCRRADEVLWQSYRFALGAAGAPWPRVMFPQKGQVRRVGEQEARFAFVAALLAEAGPEPWAFAAEVPTRLSYRFAHRGAGEKAQRALTDLVLYRHGHDEPALAVEFKSGGRSGKSEIDESIRKDVAKILAEQPDALWFHVVRGANSETLQGLLRTLDEAISRLSSPFRLSDYLAAGKTVEPRAKADRLPHLRAQRRHGGVDPSRARLRARQAQARLLHHRGRGDARLARDRRRAGLGRLSRLAAGGGLTAGTGEPHPSDRQSPGSPCPAAGTLRYPRIT